MPIVRMAVDWGDGMVDKPNVYQVQGWFKNRKKAGLCGEKTDSNDTKCSSGTNCRLRFGNSSDACEEGFYQFTHIYECKSGGAGWNDSTKSCKFTPKVQVLDNWGWCNGTCNPATTGGGCWDDPELLKKDPPEPKNQSCSIENKNTKDKHWTPFFNIIELTP